MLALILTNKIRFILTCLAGWGLWVVWWLGRGAEQPLDGFWLGRYYREQMRLPEWRRD